MGRVARGADMDHRRNVILDHLLIDRIPVAVAERRVLPMAAGGIGVQIDPDKPVFIDAAVDLGDTVLWRDARTLRQHRYTDKVLRKQRADPVDQLVAGAGPGFADRRIAQVVAHAGGARRKDRQIGAALALHLELATVDRLADLVVGDRRAWRQRLAGLVRLDLLAAPCFVLARRGRVMAVAIDDHAPLLSDQCPTPHWRTSAARCEAPAIMNPPSLPVSTSRMPMPMYFCISSSASTPPMPGHLLCLRQAAITVS